MPSTPAVRRPRIPGIAHVCPRCGCAPGRGMLSPRRLIRSRRHDPPPARRAIPARAEPRRSREAEPLLVSIRTSSETRSLPEVIEDVLALSHGKRLADGAGDITLRPLRRRFKRNAQRQASRQRRRKRAPGAMDSRVGHAFGSKFNKAVTVVQNVDDHIAWPMAAFDEDGVRPEIVYASCGFLDVLH